MQWFYHSFHRIPPNQVGTTLISFVSWPLPNTAFRPSSFSYFAVEIPCQYSNRWWYFIKFLTQLIYVFIKLLKLVWALLSPFEVRAYTFILLMILSGFILILLILILQFPVGLHSYCGPSAQVSGLRDSWRTQILSDSLQYLWIDSSQFFGTTKPLPKRSFFESKVMIMLPLTLCTPAFSILVSCRAHTSTPYWFTSLISCSFVAFSVSLLRKNFPRWIFSSVSCFSFQSPSAVDLRLLDYCW